jgi:hypothetical protein
MAQILDQLINVNLGWLHARQSLPDPTMSEPLRLVTAPLPAPQLHEVMSDPPGGVLWPVCANPVADDDGAVGTSVTLRLRSRHGHRRRRKEPTGSRHAQVQSGTGGDRPVTCGGRASSSCGRSWTSPSVSATPRQGVDPRRLDHLVPDQSRSVPSRIESCRQCRLGMSCASRAGHCQPSMTGHSPRETARGRS